MEPLSLDQVFRVLSDERRRRVLRSLAERETLGELTVLVPEDVREDDVDLDRLQLALVHVHLPILERTALVRWNRETQSISRGPRFDEILPYLDRVDDRDG